MEKENLLRLNLQFFSDNTDEPNIDTSTNEDDITDKNDEEKKDVKLFTQEEVDRILKERLNRDRKTREEDEEKKRLEEEGKYKELLENANKKIEALELEKALAARNQLINEKLQEKGLNGEQAKRYTKYVEKLVETDDEVEQAVEDVYNDFIVSTQKTYEDPTAGFGSKKEPEQKSDKDFGKELFERLNRK